MPRGENLDQEDRSKGGRSSGGQRGNNQGGGNGNGGGGNGGGQDDSDTSKRGLASADQETRQRVASEGGKASHR